MNFMAFLASVIGSTAWPAVAAYFIYQFRDEIAKAVPLLRLKKGDLEVSLFQAAQEAVLSQLPAPEDLKGEHKEKPADKGMAELSTAELRIRVTGLAGRMRELQDAYDRATGSIDWNRHRYDGGLELIRVSQDFVTRWRAELQTEANRLLDEMTKRTRWEPNDMLSQATLQSTIRLGMLAGVAPLSTAAATLERIAEHLDQPH